MDPTYAWQPNVMPNQNDQNQQEEEKRDHFSNQDQTGQDNSIDIEFESGSSQQHATSVIQQYQLTRDKTRRVIKPPQRYGFMAYSDTLSYALMTAIEIDKKGPVIY